MKIASLIFMLIGSAALTPRIGYPLSPGPGAAQQASSDSAPSTARGHSHDTEHAAPGDGKAPEKLSDGGGNGRDGSDKNHPRSRVGVTNTNRREQSPDGRKRSVSANAANFHQPSATRSGAAAKEVLIQNETVNNALPVRPPSVIRATAPSLSNVRHRTPNPAVVGGSATSARNTGAINGTHMNRKP